jgi:hypothetical protein
MLNKITTLSFHLHPIDVVVESFSLLLFPVKLILHLFKIKKPQKIPLQFNEV